MHFFMEHICVSAYVLIYLNLIYVINFLFLFSL